jgi:hypothetical protein
MKSIWFRWNPTPAAVKVKVPTARIEEATAWLNHLSGVASPWPIETAHDLREYAREITKNCTDVLTGADLQSIKNFVEVLDDLLASPEERARIAKREAKLAKRAARLAKQRPDQQTAAWQAAGALARSRGGKRARIIDAYRKVMNKPPRARAKIVADTLNVSATYVRRVVKLAGQR